MSSRFKTARRGTTLLSAQINSLALNVESKFENNAKHKNSEA